MSKQLCLIILLLTAATSTFAQNTIKGKVIDAITNQVVEGATIKSLNNKFHIVSDEKGQFNLPGTDSILITSAGYISRKIAINESEITIFLSPSFSNLNEVVVSGAGNYKKEPKYL